MSIFDLTRNEARLFKYGSGTGTNFSGLRGNMERLSSGGTSSGLMSFLEVLDRGAGAKAPVVATIGGAWRGHRASGSRGR